MRAFNAGVFFRYERFFRGFHTAWTDVLFVWFVFQSGFLAKSRESSVSIGLPNKRIIYIMRLNRDYKFELSQSGGASWQK